MKKKQRTLRFKLTAMMVCTMTLMCITLTLISLSASRLITKAKLVTPSITVPSLSDTTPISVIVLEPSTPALAAQQSFNGIAIFSMLLVVAAGGGFVFFYVKRELRPLELLSAQVAKLDAETLSTPIEIHATGDEIEQLSNAIGEMAARVSDAYLMQKSFSSSAAHELRTPLAAIQAKIEVFQLKKTRSLPEYNRLIETIGRNTQRLSDLVAELLELTRQVPVELTEPINLRLLAEEAAMDLEPLALQKQVTLRILGDATVTGNDCLLQRAVFNLMQNAIKYNLPGGTVTVTLKQREPGAVLSVSDTGIGIPEEMQGRVFEFFFRVEHSRSREMGGNGLGLAIVKRIVLQHGGKITVKSNQPQGSCFEIVL